MRRKRLLASYQIEFSLMEQGYRLIAGVDEVGRGALAGPVFAAAVILQLDFVIENISDSKLLTPAQRERLAEQIRSRAIAFSIGSASEGEIDRMGISNATLAAMLRAVNGLKVRPDFLLVDALQIPGLEIPQLKVIKGDQRCASIAAASILAKVARDATMRALAGEFPAYNFGRNKGYGTAEHIRALAEYGPCLIHRRTFRPVSQYERGRPAEGLSDGNR